MPRLRTALTFSQNLTSFSRHAILPTWLKALSNEIRDQVV
jgi:hypothetical protein